MTWKGIRQIRWTDTYEHLYKYLLTSELPTDRSVSSLARFKRLAKNFVLSGDEVVLETNTIPPELLDEEGNPLVDVKLPMSFLVVKPTEKDQTIQAVYESNLAGGYKGIESLYRKISGQYLGITRQDIAQVLSRQELKLLKRPTQTRDMKPIIASKPAVANGFD